MKTIVIILALTFTSSLFSQSEALTSSYAKIWV